MCEQCILPLHMRKISHFMVRCRSSSGLLLRLERGSLSAPGAVAVNREALAPLLRPLALRLLGKLFPARLRGTCVSAACMHPACVCLQWPALRFLSGQDSICPVSSSSRAFANTCIAHSDLRLTAYASRLSMSCVSMLSCECLQRCFARSSAHPAPDLLWCFQLLRRPVRRPARRAVPLDGSA